MAEWKTTNRDADADTLLELNTIRDRSRDARRNIPLAAGALATKVTNVVGSGLKLQATIDSDALGMSDDQAAEWEANTEREFGLWSESTFSDVERCLTFFEQQELAFSSTLENGDAFVILASIQRPRFPYRLAIQLIEADRVSNPDFRRDTTTMAGGIEKGARGQPIAVHVRRTHPGQRFTRNATWDRIEIFGARTDRRNVLHLFKKLRIAQTRGVPDLAPVMEPLKQLGRYSQAELDAAVVASFFTVFTKTEQGDGLAPNTASDVGGKETDEDYKLGSATILDLEPGEDITIANPGRPNDSFDPFVQAILRQIGVALEIPFELLIKHFTSSYTAARASIEEAWKFFRGRRMWLARRFCQPIYETWLSEAIALGRIAAPGFLAGDPRIRKAFSGTQWVGPPRGQINERLEMDAATRRVRLGVSTLSRETAEIVGVDWRVIHRQRAREVELRREAGLEPPLEEQTGDRPPTTTALDLTSTVEEARQWRALNDRRLRT